MYNIIFPRTAGDSIAGVRPVEAHARHKAGPWFGSKQDVAVVNHVYAPDLSTRAKFLFRWTSWRLTSKSLTITIAMDVVVVNVAVGVFFAIVIMH